MSCKVCNLNGRCSLMMRQNPTFFGWKRNECCGSISICLSVEEFVVLRQQSYKGWTEIRRAVLWRLSWLVQQRFVLPYISNQGHYKKGKVLRISETDGGLRRGSSEKATIYGSQLQTFLAFFNHFSRNSFFQYAFQLRSSSVYINLLSLLMPSNSR